MRIELFFTMLFIHISLHSMGNNSLLNAAIRGDLESLQVLRHLREQSARPSRHQSSILYYGHGFDGLKCILGAKEIGKQLRADDYDFPDVTYLNTCAYEPFVTILKKFPAASAYSLAKGIKADLEKEIHATQTWLDHEHNYPEMPKDEFNKYLNHTKERLEKLKKEAEELNTIPKPNLNALLSLL